MNYTLVCLFFMVSGALPSCLAVGFTSKDLEKDLVHEIELFDDFDVLAPVHFRVIARNDKAVQFGDEYVKLNVSRLTIKGTGAYNELVSQIYETVGESYSVDVPGRFTKNRSGFCFRRDQVSQESKLRAVLVTSSLDDYSAFNHFLIVRLEKDEVLLIQGIGAKYPDGVEQAASIFTVETLLSLRINKHARLKKCDG